MKKHKRPKFGKKLVFVLSIKPYHQELVVVCNGQFSDAFKFMKRFKTKNAKENIEYIEKMKKECDGNFADNHKRGGARLYTELPNSYVMLIDHLNSWLDTVGNVTHESLHLTYFILKRAGVTLSEESEESFTYLTQETVENILEKIY